MLGTDMDIKWIKQNQCKEKMYYTLAFLEITLSLPMLIKYNIIYMLIKYSLVIIK